MTKTKKLIKHYSTYNIKGKKTYLCQGNATNYSEKKVAKNIEGVTCHNCRKILLLDKKKMI